MFCNFVDELRWKGNVMIAQKLKEKSQVLTGRVVKLCRELQDTYSEAVLSERLLTTCAALGRTLASIEQAESMDSYLQQMDLVHQTLTRIAHYIELLKATNYISPKVYYSFYDEIEELITLVADASTSKSVETKGGLVQWETIYWRL